MAYLPGTKNRCLLCEKETARKGRIYCSNNCQQEFQYKKYIEQWKESKITGITSIGIVSRHIKKYLRIKYNNRCCLCGWANTNPKTRVVPLVADHIDGNWKNNTEDNLRLICPNCDSLTETYGALNKGRGRETRTLSRRTIEARLLE